MKKPVIPVTDHAVLRYLERVCGVNIEAIRHRIGRKVDLCLDHPTATGVVSDGFLYRIADGRVVRIVQHSQPNIRTGRKRRRGAR